MFKSQKIVRLIMAFAMALALGGSIPLDGSHMARAALGSVTGTVTDGTTGDPLYPATITIEQFDTGDPVGTFSNFADGSFLIGIPAGTYRIGASADGYITGWHPINSAKEDATAVTVPDGGSVTDINFSLEQGGSISGTVRNQWDGTEQNQVVTVWTADTLESVSWTFTNESDGHGQYVIGDLPYGDYKVTIGGLSGSFTVAEAVDVTEPEGEPAEFVISNLTASPSEVGVGETVTISILVSNIGDLEGSYRVVLEIAGEIVATRTVTVVGGASQEVIFTTSEDTAGGYRVDIGGESTTFTVTPGTIPSDETDETPEPRRLNWWLIGGAIAAAAFVALFALLIRRQIRAS